MKNFIIAVVGFCLITFSAFIFLTHKSDNRTILGENQIAVASPSQIPIVNKQMEESSKTAVRKTYQSPPPVLAASEIANKKIRITTSKGDIVFQLFEDAPIAASNFIFLTNEGFYNGLTFHRRVDGFVIQGGDPNGDGTGGPGYKFKDEPVTRDYTRGTIAMANSGPDTNGSQFFIMLADNPLPKNYTIFGKVIEGLNVVDQIKIGDVMQKVAVE